MLVEHQGEHESEWAAKRPVDVLRARGASGESRLATDACEARNGAVL